MRIEYAVSTWNFTHYNPIPSLEFAIQGIRALGYGIEFWESYGGEPFLFDSVRRRVVRQLLEGMQVSIHYQGLSTLIDHKRCIDAACELGAGVVVVHPKHLAFMDSERVNVTLAREATACAADQGIRIALENVSSQASLAFLSEAIDEVEGLGICLDTGHLYQYDKQLHVPPPISMREFLECVGGRLIHLHIEDILPESELGLPGVENTHFIPGTGGIPTEDWESLAKTLHAIDFAGMAVFEIRPRTPLQTALLGMEFMRKRLQQPRGEHKPAGED